MRSPCELRQGTFGACAEVRVRVGGTSSGTAYANTLTGTSRLLLALLAPLARSVRAFDPSYKLTARLGSHGVVSRRHSPGGATGTLTVTSRDLPARRSLLSRQTRELDRRFWYLHWPTCSRTEVEGEVLGDSRVQFCHWETFLSLSLLRQNCRLKFLGRPVCAPSAKKRLDELAVGGSSCTASREGITALLYVICIR